MTTYALILLAGVVLGSFLDSLAHLAQEAVDRVLSVIRRRLRKALGRDDLTQYGADRN